MPNYKKPEDLFSASLRVLADTVIRATQNALLSSESTIDLHSVGIKQFVSDIPSFFADQYVAEVLKLASALPKEAQTKQLVAMVLHPNCQTLDMSNPKLLVNPKCLKSAVLANLDRLPQLKYLDVRFCAAAIDESLDNRDKEAILCLETYIQTLHNLEVVNLSYVCTSAALRAVVDNCPNLVRFCAQDSFLHRGDAQLLSNLPKLKWVFIDSYEEPVLPEDIAYLLCNLPLLTHIEYADMEGVITVLKKWHQEGTAAPPFPLKDFAAGVHKCTADVLDEFCSFFPNLESIGLYKPVGTVAPLGNLKFLKNLRVNQALPEVVFEYLSEGHCTLQELTLYSISPFDSVFKRKGFVLPSLRVLRVYCCNNVDVTALHLTLPNLKKLQLCYCTASRRDSYWSNDSSMAFSNLQHLEISGSFEASHLLQLLSTCKGLKELDIGGYSFLGTTYADVTPSDFVRDVVTDDLWQLVTKINPMRNLRRLRLTSDRLTKAVIPQIIQAFDELEVLSLSGQQWSQELPLSETHSLLEFLQPYDVQLNIEGVGLYQVHYPVRAVVNRN